jgi:hypothetical protein
MIEIEPEALANLIDANQLVFATIKNYYAHDNDYFRACHPTSAEDDMNLIRAAVACLRTARLLAGLG